MEEARFRALRKRIRDLDSDYGRGFQSGLNRLYYGERYGEPRHHEKKLKRTDEYGRGYRDGFAGGDPSPLIGRPPLPPGAERSDKKVRSIRLSEADWEKLKRLGYSWLEEQIQAAPEPLAGAE